MRLIDADKLYPDCLTKRGTLAISQSQIANAPASVYTITSDTFVEGASAEIPTVPNEYIGHWTCIKDNNYAGGGYWECPSCKDRFSFQGFNLLNDMPYCPRCGNRVKTESEAENE